MTELTVFQDLYDSEINFFISTFWDGGFDVKLGDGMNGFKWSGCENTMEGAAEQLKKAALEHYPKSGFAKKHGGQG